MNIILGILLVLVFVFSAYYIGNKILNTFDEEIGVKIVSFFVGWLINGVIIGILYLCYVIFMIGYNAL